jgi:hypothetical protein
MPEAIAPHHIAASLTEHWSPRVVGEVDDNYVKVAKLLGVFGWHAHDQEDEMFLVLRSRLKIELEAGAVEIGERKTTPHSGNEVNEHTRSIAEQLRPVMP